MTSFPGQDPAPGDKPACEAIDQIIVPRARSRRLHGAPRAAAAQRRMVGPFIFFDHMGPAEFRDGQGIDVRPHPHIGLATVTYLFEGEIVHRDSLGIASADPARRGQLDDGGPRHRPFRAHRAGRARRRRRPGRPAALGRAAGAQRGDRAQLRASRRARSCRRSEANGATRAPDRRRAVRAHLAGEDAVSTTVLCRRRRWRRARAIAARRAEERAVYVVDGEVEIAGDRSAPGQLLVFRPRCRDRVGRERGARRSARRRRRWTARATSGGISCRPARSGSSRPRPIGKSAASTPFPATRSNSFALPE